MVNKYDRIFARRMKKKTIISGYSSDMEYDYTWNEVGVIDTDVLGNTMFYPDDRFGFTAREMRIIAKEIVWREKYDKENNIFVGDLI